jgi:hypothetical protein
LTAGDFPEVRGEVFGLFRKLGGAPGLTFGAFREGAWKLEDVTGEADDEAVLGFDDECRPFVALRDSVWSRGASGWPRSSIGPGSKRKIKGLVGFQGTLYAAYGERKDGVKWAGVATAPLVAEAR